jgi:hypothetical protein
MNHAKSVFKAPSRRFSAQTLRPGERVSRRWIFGALRARMSLRDFRASKRAQRQHSREKHD